MRKESRDNKPEQSELSRVEKASIQDVDGILDLQSEKLIIPEDEQENTRVKDRGFLVYPLSHEELSNLIEKGEDAGYFVKVVKAGDKIAGYLISYSLKNWITSHPDWINRLDSTIKDSGLFNPDDVLYGRHIAVDERLPITGIGSRLMDEQLSQASNLGYSRFLVEILQEPISNDRSVRFVKNLGFREIGQIHDENKRIWSVWTKEIL